jgi:hypothetical protein
MTEQGLRVSQDVPLRACCGALRWTLLDAIESLPAGAHLGALRWGPAEVPLDLRVGDVPAARAVEAILDAAQRRLGAGAFCYAGLGALVIDARKGEGQGGIGDGVP